MRKHYFLFFLLIFVFLNKQNFAQDYSNKGTNFWISYPEHIDGTNSMMGLYITSDVNTSGTITINGANVPFTVTANTIQPRFITATGVGTNVIGTNSYVHLGSLQDGIRTNGAIHITSLMPVVVYAHIIRSARSGATLALPTQVWGKEYIVPSYANSGGNGANQGYGELNIMASLPNTQVEITPSINTRNNTHSAGTPYTITLANPGDVYQVQFPQNGDMSGTIVKSVASGSTGCQPIAVISATTWTALNCGSGNGGDNLYQQLFPYGAWGKEFVTSPLKKTSNPADLNIDVLRVYVKDPTTVVKKIENGLTTVLAGYNATGMYYEYSTSNPTFLYADKPVQVVQYITTQNCGTWPSANSPTQSDPEMISLSSTEQTIEDITVYSAISNNVPSGNSQVNVHYINVIMKSANTGTFTINGTPPSASWNTIPGTSYSYLKQQITNAATDPVSRLKADSGFNAYAYGLGNVESYGYNAGTYVKDLNTALEIGNVYGIENFPVACVGSPFNFKIYLPDKSNSSPPVPIRYDSIRWDCSNIGAMSPSNFPYIQYGAPTINPDSVTIRNGKDVAWYSVPGLYSFTTPGVYTITITVYRTSADGCGNSQEYSFPLTVTAPPSADFNFANSVCTNSPIQFNDNTPPVGSPPYKWWWDFGDPPSGVNNNSLLQNPTHLFSSPGTYSVKFSNITRAGCLSDTVTKTIEVTNPPTANFTVVSPNCSNTSIQFTDASTLAGSGSITQWSWDFGDPASGASNTSTSQNPAHTYATTGTYTVTLISKTNTNCASAPYTFQVVIQPDATITLSSAAGTDNQTICINTALSNITYTIGGSGNGGTVTGLPAGVTGTYAGGVVTITGTPTASGTFNYTVQTQGPCITPSLTGVITITADATIGLTSPAGSDQQTICINTPLSLLTYNVGGSGTGGTVTGLPAGVTGAYSSGVITISGSPTVSGTFNYTVNTAGPCVKPTATGTIIVTPDATINLTSGAGTNNQTKCINTPIANITYAIGGSGNGGTVSGLPAGVTGTYAGGVVTISGTPTVSGTFNYTVNTTGPCVTPSATGTIIITPDAHVNLTSGGPSAAQELCVNSTLTNITYSVTASGTGGTVTGLPAGVTGTFAGGVITISGVPTVSGTFTYTVTATGPCASASATGTITVNALPTSNFNNTIPSCETRTINFTDLSIANSGNNVRWVWDFGDATSPVTINAPASPNITHTYSAAGTYNVSLVVTTDKGCISIQPPKPVTINLKPKAGFIIPDFCINDVATVFTDTSRIAAPGTFDPNGYYWDFGDPASGAGNISTAMNGTHTFTAVGNYNIMHIATSAQGCRDTIYQSVFVNASDPVADFTVNIPANLCSYDSVAIKNLSSVSQGRVFKLEVYWDAVGAPGVFQTINNPNVNDIYRHKYPTLHTTQTYTIKMVAYSGSVCFNTKSINVTVNASPITQFLQVPNVCFDAAPFQITQASETGSLPGTVFYSGPGVSPTGLFTPSSVVPGSTNTIQYLFVSTAGGCKDSITQTITVWDTAAAKITVAPITCEKNAIAFSSGSSTLSTNAGTISGWNWNFGDPASGPLNTSTNANPSHQYNTWGNYTVSLQVTTSNNCKSTIQTIPVKVNPLPIPNFSLPAASCLPSASLVFVDNSSVPDGSTPGGYLWNFGDPASGVNNFASNSNPTHIYNTVGPFNVKLNVTTNAGCIDSITKVVNNIHPQPITAINVNKVDVCIGDSFTFSNTSDPVEGSITQYVWSLDNGDTRNIPSFTYTYPTVGVYNVSLYIYNTQGCKSNVAVKTVSANPYPVANAGPDKFMLEGGQVELTPVLVTNIPVSYSWTPITYLVNPNVSNALASPPNDFTYTLKVTSDKGCSSTDQVFIKVLKMPAIPNIFSPNGDGVHDTWVIEYLDTYPGSTVDIYNRYGQPIFHSNGYTKPWDGTVNGKPVPVGTYYYVIDPKNGRKILTGYVDVIR